MSKKVLIIVAVIGVLFVCCVAVVILGGKAIIDSQPKNGTTTTVSQDIVQTQLEEEAKKMNAQLPMMLDNITRIDKAEALPNRVFRYTYTVIPAAGQVIDPESAKAIVEKSNTENIKTNEALKAMRANKVTFSYVYNDEAGKLIFSFDVTPDKYAE